MSGTLVSSLPPGETLRVRLSSDYSIISAEKHILNSLFVLCFIRFSPTTNSFVSKLTAAALKSEIDKGVIGRADDKGNGENKQGKVDAVADDLHGYGLRFWQTLCDGQHTHKANGYI